MKEVENMKTVLDIAVVGKLIAVSKEIRAWLRFLDDKQKKKTTYIP